MEIACTLMDEKGTVTLKVFVPKTHSQTLIMRITSNKFQ